MNNEAFKQIKEEITNFKYTSMTYMDFDELESYNIIEMTSELILIQSSNKYHYACDTLDYLISSIGEKAMIPFVHETWVSKMEDLGFKIIAHYQDYFSTSEVDYTPYQFAKLSDAKRMSDITKACYNQSRGFFGEEVEWIENWLTADNHNIITQYDGDILVGICCVAMYGFDKGPYLWIREVAVHPAFQKKGYGRQLIAKGMTYGHDRGARKAFLAADELNVHAIKLYESFGFKASGDSQIDMERI